MNKVKIFCFTLGVTMIFAAFLLSQEQEFTRIQSSSKPREEDIVSSDLACRIALRYARKQFDVGAISKKPIIGYGLDGNPGVYIWTFTIGEKDEFPTEPEILKDLSDARKLLPELKAELATVREASLRLKRDGLKFEERGNRSFLQKNGEWKEAEERLRDIENKCWGMEEFGTMYISARKDVIPILGFSNVLPYYYTYREDTEKMAREVLGPDISLVRVYYGSDLDQIFEYESHSGDKTWVLLFPPRIVKPGEITPKSLKLTDKERKLIQSEWDKVMQEVLQNER